MIKLLITGGTIDKVYDELTGRLVFRETHVPDMLKRSRCSADIAVETLFLKDSLDFLEADRSLILARCLACSESQFLITHGTDTMVETAAVLGEQITDKTIVLTGAMIPYSITNSDALFNLGAAVAAVQCLPHGIYIMMNGKVFPWQDVQKNRAAGIFEPISGE